MDKQLANAEKAYLKAKANARKVYQEAVTNAEKACLEAIANNAEILSAKKMETFEEFVQGKLELLVKPSYYEGKPPTEKELWRIEVIKDLLFEFRQRRMLQSIKELNSLRR